MYRFGTYTLSIFVINYLNVTYFYSQLPCLDTVNDLEKFIASKLTFLYYRQLKQSSFTKFNIYPQIYQKCLESLGGLSVLSRFVSKSVNRCTKFFRMLNDPKDFWQTGQYETAFFKLQALLSNNLVLSKPIPSEDLFDKSLITHIQRIIWSRFKVILRIFQKNFVCIWLKF